MLGRPRFEIRITHEPTGISAYRSSDHFRTMCEARESAMRYLKSRLYQIEPKEKDLTIEYGPTK